MKRRLVIIGNGMAPGRMLERLFDAAPDAYDVTIFNAEPRVNYDRILLSPVLSGEKRFEDIIIHDDAWYARHDVTLHKGKRIVSIDRAARRIVAADGTIADYDRLVIATGSTPIILPFPGHRLPGVVAYRDLDDVDVMLRAAETGRRAIVIGGGLLGLEAAAGLRMRGMDVTVIHLMPTLMERQLDPAAGHLLMRAIEARGIAVLLSAETKALIGDTHVTGIALADGRTFPADLVVIAVGIRPSAGLARDAGLDIGRGIIVDDHMRTSDPAILAIGECAEHRGTCYGLVAPLYEMAKVAAATLLDEASLPYRGSLTSTKLKVTGIDLFSAGDFADGPDREEIVFRDPARGVYKRLVIENDRIAGVVLYGDTADGPWFFDRLKSGEPIGTMRDTLIFGPGWQGGTALDPAAALAALPNEVEICGCNGVCKGDILSAITSKGLATLADVRAHTKASASCGTCTSKVEALMASAIGDGYKAATVEPMCGCTDLGHDAIRRAIRVKGLTTIPDVMHALAWSSSGGCARCRPALNYYLLCEWPDTYVDDQQSRFINERVHANIQKDGTYSVVPRMWGGVTSPAELRAIADVADKYQIPTVKLTGGQRIDLLGVRKEDLPGVWADLNRAGMVSGHAYAKGLRTVKTCVGSEWCRFGTQDSTGLGVRLEKYLWGSWTPAKVKLGVSGCPRNCAESTCKDIGVICVESGYEIHYGGAAGLHIQGTSVLTKVETEDECIEIIAALTQYYREDGRYLERIYKWMKRIGEEAIRAAIVDDLDNRRSLVARFEKSQTSAQVDPWAERVAGRDAHEFAPLARIPYEEAAE